MALCWATAAGCSQLPSAIVKCCSQFDGHRTICSSFCQQPNEAGQRASSSHPPGLGRNQDTIAQTMRQQQQSQIAPQGCTSGAQNWSASTAGTFEPRQQQQLQVNVFQQMQSALAALNPSAPAGQTLESSTRYHMASAMAIAMMTPFLQTLEQQQERQQEEKRVMVAKMECMNRRLQCIENKLDSNATSYPLMALAMAQQKHALARLPCCRLQ